MGLSGRFTIYNASAGSGKTFALVKSYLAKILSHPDPGYFKHLLAITFTNKAVAEMKRRVIENLVGFSSESIPRESQDMIELISRELNMSQPQIQTRARAIVKQLLHNYAQFSVETIDHFNHRLIRTFARDLNLSTRFEVSLDVPQLIAQAVDRVVEKAGEDSLITKVLVEFALQKTDDDKSWDIALDLYKASSLLSSETDMASLNKLRDKDLSQFMQLRDTLYDQAATIEDTLKGLAGNVMDVFVENRLDASHFDRKYAYVFFQKIAQGQFQLNYHTAWQRNLGVKPLYPSRVTGSEAATLDRLTPLIIDAFQKIKEQVHNLFLLQNILKNIVPLATIHLVRQELEQIMEEDEVVPINRFNALIHEQIKDQPAPFIYERLGDRYRDFFIDEFQDTSILQWSNLVPLIDNALSQYYQGDEGGSLLLVGDAKQSIYRWRGGVPEQFIKLYDDGDPFRATPDKNIETLPFNFRSGSEIIAFNNKFFQFMSDHFSDPAHENLYRLGAQQKTAGKEGGYVRIEFITPLDTEEANLLYARQTHRLIEEAIQKGYEPKDICILTRKKRDGILISEHLLSKGITVISEDTLLLKNSPQVRCIAQVLRLIVTPNNEEVKIALLEFLYTHLNVQQPKHDFLSMFVHSTLVQISEEIATMDIFLDFEALRYKSLYEACEHIIQALQLNQDADAFLFSFMDLVFAYSQRPEAGKSSFVDYWLEEQERASLPENKSANAVSVMTIHRAKGLEYPVVIFPYADLDLYRELDPMAWYPFNDLGYEQLLINYSNKVADYGDAGAALVANRRKMLELDNVNLLYVTMTRAKQELHILARQPKSSKEPASYNAFFKEFLIDIGKWQDDTLVYEFGVPLISAETTSAGSTGVPLPYNVSLPEEHQIKIVASDKEPPSAENLRAIAIGNLLHDAMATLHYSEETESVLEELRNTLLEEPDTFEQVRTLLLAVVDHPQLRALYQPPDIVMNERDIISPERILRPDRINLHPDGSVTVIDYKTGVPQESYAHQIDRYARALTDMGYSVRNKLLVYTNSDGVLINKT
ncbi:MAG: UvrD-helicase domain-containing protein [Bacteroidota bacterium]